MSHETYQQLRQEFQELRHQYEQSTGPRFCIKICVPGYSSTAEPPYDPEKFQPIASVSLPFEAGYVPSPVQDDEVGLLGVALAPKAKATKDAVTRFIELSRTAGENLPGDITHSLKGLSSDLMDDPISKWLALLIVLNDCHRGDSVIIRPFLNSIEAIDRCKLAGEQSPSDSTGKDSRRLPGKREKQIEWLTKAMLRVQENPGWSDAEIAESVGKHPSTLSRSQTYQMAAKMARGTQGDRHRGHITTDSETDQLDVEAYSDDSNLEE